MTRPEAEALRVKRRLRGLLDPQQAAPPVCDNPNQELEASEAIKKVQLSYTAEIV